MSKHEEFYTNYLSKDGFEITSMTDNGGGRMAASLVVRDNTDCFIEIEDAGSWEAEDLMMLISNLTTIYCQLVGAQGEDDCGSSWAGFAREYDAMTVENKIAYLERGLSFSAEGTFRRGYFEAEINKLKTGG